jgi:hypothetical protein
MMQFSRAAPPLLALILVADVQAAMHVTDCLNQDAERVAAASRDCEQLERLSALFSRPVRSAVPDPAQLDSILAAIGQVDEPKSLWELFGDWLAARLHELQDAVPDFPNPFGWLIGGLTQAGLLLLGAICLFALAALVRVLIARRGQLRRVVHALRPAAAGDAAARSPTFADAEAAPPAQRPRILLALVVAALRAANRLGADVALSHRQLGPAARNITDGQRAGIAWLAGLAERVTYSRFVPGEAELAHAMATSQALVAGVAR